MKGGKEVKKRVLILLLLLIFVFVGCKKEYNIVSPSPTPVQTFPNIQPVSVDYCEIYMEGDSTMSPWNMYVGCTYQNIGNAGGHATAMLQVTKSDGTVIDSYNERIFLSPSQKIFVSRIFRITRYFVLLDRWKCACL